MDKFFKTPHNGGLIEGAKRKFLNSSDSTSVDKVQTKDPLGKGAYGDVHEVQITKGSHELKFALKDYRKQGPLSEARKFVKKALENYKLLKEKGFTVFSTCRTNGEGTQLLTTLGTNENTTIISNGSNIEFKKVEVISNIPEIVETLIKDATRAADNGISFNADAYFFWIQNEHPENVNVIIGDYDAVFISNANRNSLLERNLETAKRAMGILLDLYVENKNQENRARILMKEAIEAHNIK